MLPETLIEKEQQHLKMQLELRMRQALTMLSSATASLLEVQKAFGDSLCRLAEFSSRTQKSRDVCVLPKDVPKTKALSRKFHFCNQLQLDKSSFIKQTAFRCSVTRDHKYLRRVIASIRLHSKSANTRRADMPYTSVNPGLGDGENGA
jgi:hypothetical protein